MFIKSALALILTVGFAGGAVYYGTNTGNTEGGETGGTFSFLQPKTNEVKIAVPQEADAVPAPVAKKTPVKKVVKKLPAKKTAAKKTAVKKKAVAKKKLVIKKKTAKKQIVEPIGSTKSPNVPEALDLKRIMPMLMVQAGRINSVDIKDQAYLDIVSFSVSQRQFYFADAALEKIDQAELRDTARSQIAIALALDGKADEAFEVIDAVEIDTLRDVMRLQVIEALILPQKLPPGMQ